MTEFEGFARAPDSFVARMNFAFAKSFIHRRDGCDGALSNAQHDAACLAAGEPHPQIREQ
jgi:hypothetical protein